MLHWFPLSHCVTCSVKRLCGLPDSCRYATLVSPFPLCYLLCKTVRWTAMQLPLCYIGFPFPTVLPALYNGSEDCQTVAVMLHWFPLSHFVTCSVKRLCGLLCSCRYATLVSPVWLSLCTGKTGGSLQGDGIRPGEIAVCYRHSPRDHPGEGGCSKD